MKTNLKINLFKYRQISKIFRALIYLNNCTMSKKNLQGLRSCIIASIEQIKIQPDKMQILKRVSFY